MDPSELLRVVAEKFDLLGIAYFVTGSMATITYGEPRFTNDVDIVARVRVNHVDALLGQFPAPEFYCSKDAVIQAIESHRMFNIIHPNSGLKLDVVIPEDDAFNASRFERCRKLSIGEQMKVFFASPEDVILKKLTYFKQGGSEKHVRDMRGVLKLQEGKLDMAYLQTWAKTLDVLKELELVLNGG